jgi:HAD superfamily hydrolase (TIGR01509 family)
MLAEEAAGSQGCLNACYGKGMTSTPGPFNAVLFDLDGTLVDNMSYHIDAWIEIGRELGKELSRGQIMREFSGRKNEELLPMVAGRALAAAELAQLAARKESLYRKLFAPHLALVAGALELLDQLDARGVAYGIASAAPSDNRAFVLDRFGLSARMKTIVGAEEVTRGKPAPDLFLEAARRMGASPGNTLVFEDAVGGVQAGLAAGMQVCGVTTAESPEALVAAGAFATIRDFRELPHTLKKSLELA